MEWRRFGSFRGRVCFKNALASHSASCASTRARLTSRAHAGIGVPCGWLARARWGLLPRWRPQHSLIESGWPHGQLLQLQLPSELTFVYLHHLFNGRQLIEELFITSKVMLKQQTCYLKTFIINLKGIMFL